MDTREVTTLIPRLVIRFYQLARTGSPRRCRFVPSCSEYTLHALETKGLWKALSLGAQRLLKCHPWHPGGYDPIPQ